MFDFLSQNGYVFFRSECHYHQTWPAIRHLGVVRERGDIGTTASKFGMIEEPMQICVTPECPVVFSKKVCEAKDNSHVALLPQVQN